MAVLIRTISALLLAGCFGPAGRDCAITCSMSGGCPTGFVCLSDNYCHEQGDTELCGEGAGPDAPPQVDPPDAPPPPMMVQLIADADTFLQDTREGDNFGGDVAIGLDGAASSGSHVIGLIHFDLTGVPAGSEIAAPPVLRLCTTDTFLSGGGVSVHRVIEEWSEGTGDRDANQAGDPGVANWSQRLAATAWTTPGAGAPGSRDMASAVEGGQLFTPTAADTTYSLELVDEVVQGWIDTPAMNYGLALVPSTDSGNAFLVASEGSNADCHPQLTVMYR